MPRTQDRSLDDLHPEVGISVNNFHHYVNLDPDLVHHSKNGPIWNFYIGRSLIYEDFHSYFSSESKHRSTNHNLTENGKSNPVCHRSIYWRLISQFIFALKHSKLKSVFFQIPIAGSLIIIGINQGRKNPSNLNDFYWNYICSQSTNLIIK